jgi:hypothetical protein
MKLFKKDNSSEETNTKNILIIVFVIFGVVLIAMILIGAFAYWRYRKWGKIFKFLKRFNIWRIIIQKHRNLSKKLVQPSAKKFPSKDHLPPLMPQGPSSSGFSLMKENTQLNLIKESTSIKSTQKQVDEKNLPLEPIQQGDVSTKVNVKKEEKIVIKTEETEEIFKNHV